MGYKYKCSVLLIELSDCITAISVALSRALVSSSNTNTAGSHKERALCPDAVFDRLKASSLTKCFITLGRIIYNKIMKLSMFTYKIWLF